MRLLKVSAFLLCNIIHSNNNKKIFNNIFNEKSSEEIDVDLRLQLDSQLKRAVVRIEIQNIGIQSESENAKGR